MSALPTLDVVNLVNRANVPASVDATWALVGGFFDLHLFLDVACEAVSGDGDIGSVRQIGTGILEVMVGAGAFSYTYAQTHGPMSAHAYHGCVTCEASGADACVIVYTLVYDQSGIDPSLRISEQERLSKRFAMAVDAMRLRASP